MSIIEHYGSWVIHTSFLIGQSFMAYKAQNNPAWAWVMAPLSVAQSTFPSPFKKITATATATDK